MLPLIRHSHFHRIRGRGDVSGKNGCGGGAKRLGAAIAAVCTLLLLLGVWAVWNGAQAAMREQAAQSLSTAVLDAAVQCYALEGHTRRAFPIWKKTMACRSTTAGLLSAMRRMHRTSCRSSPCWKSRRHDSLRRGIRQNEGRRRSEKHGAFWMHLYPLLLFAIIVLSLLFLVMTGTGFTVRSWTARRGTERRARVISCRAGACGGRGGSCFRWGRPRGRGAAAAGERRRRNLRNPYLFI